MSDFRFSSSAQAALSFREIAIKHSQRYPDRFLDVVRRKVSTPILSDREQIANQCLDALKIATVRIWDGHIYDMAQSGHESFAGAVVKKEWMPIAPVFEIIEPEYPKTGNVSHPVCKTFHYDVGTAIGFARLIVPFATGGKHYTYCFTLLREPGSPGAWLSPESVIIEGSDIGDVPANTAFCARECFTTNYVSERTQQVLHPKQTKRHKQERPDFIQPDIHKIILRRMAKDQNSEGNARSQEYSCQWVVRAHWRNQFHPSTGERKPIFILPHIKGDPEKPFKMAPNTVTAVVK